MEWLNVCISAALFAQGDAPRAPAPPAPPVPPKPVPVAVAAPATATSAPVVVAEGGWRKAGSCNECCEEKRFESDRCFDGFIGPVTSPIYAKDPRSLTELRALYVHNWNPGDRFLNGGDYDLYGLQVRVALNEKLSVFMDKAGFLSVNAGNAGIRDRDGWLDLGLGVKYTFLRDVCEQEVAAVGVMYEFATGEDEVFQGRGDGIITPFITYGKEFGDCWHFIGNAAYSAAVDSSENSSFLFSQLHLDKGINGWLYPLVELNWFYYTQSGNTTRPAGERDGVFSFGDEGTAGTHRLTIAGGLKAKLRRNIETGVAYERALTGGDDLFNHRIVGEFILRY
jgi:hypothetical protein